MFDKNMLRKYRKIMFHPTGRKEIMTLITAVMLIPTYKNNISKIAGTNWFMFGAALKPLCVGYKNYCFIIILE